jgi:hypothetical protein
VVGGGRAQRYGWLTAGVVVCIGVTVVATTVAAASRERARPREARLVARPVATEVRFGTITGSTTAEDKSTAGIDFRTGGAVTEQGIMACPVPSAEEQYEAKLAAAVGAPPVVPPAGPVRVLVVGDSLGCSLATGLGPAGVPALVVREATIIGCGAVSDQVFDEHEPFTRGTERCKWWAPAVQRDGLRTFAPHVVLWVSTWERLNLVVGDRVVRTGSAAWRAELGRRLEVGRQRLTAGGARLAMMTVAAPTPASMIGGRRIVSAKYDWRFAMLNRELQRFAAAHPDTLLVDAAGKLCPRGAPCPEDVGGARPRDGDGVHPKPAGAVWLSRWMLPQLLAAIDPPTA